MGRQNEYCRTYQQADRMPCYDTQYQRLHTRIDRQHSGCFSAMKMKGKSDKEKMKSRDDKIKGGGGGGSRDGGKVPALNHPCAE
jgi:hypothetical protein